VEYRWWTFRGQRERQYTWLKLGPVTLLWGRFLFAHDGLAVELHFLDEMVWCNY
jgi:hypothetical protein